MFAAPSSLEHVRWPSSKSERNSWKAPTLTKTNMSGTTSTDLRLSQEQHFGRVCAHARTHSGSPESQRSDGRVCSIESRMVEWQDAHCPLCDCSEGSRLSKVEDTSTVDMLQRLHPTAIAMRHFSQLFGPPSKKTTRNPPAPTKKP